MVQPPFEVNLTSMLLQNKEADLKSATIHLQVTKNYLVGSRCNGDFQQVLTDATEIAKELEIPPNFETEQFRKRRKKLQLEYEAQEETPEDQRQKFNVGFYYFVLDLAIQSVEERFQWLQQYNSLFGFLYDICSIKKKSTKDVLKACKNLGKSLRHNGNKDIDAEDLCCEPIAIVQRLSMSMLPQGVLLFILLHKLIDNMPNVSVALRILLTLPLSVANNEHSFSKLKLPNLTYTQQCCLATISIEHAQASAHDLN